jgi:fructose-bisphosphate aldolase class I
MVLKPNMVMPGKKSRQKSSPEQVAEATVRDLKRHVPLGGARHRVPVRRSSSVEATLHLT